MTSSLHIAIRDSRLTPLPVRVLAWWLTRADPTTPPTIADLCTGVPGTAGALRAAVQRLVELGYLGAGLRRMRRAKVASVPD